MGLSNSVGARTPDWHWVEGGLRRMLEPLTHGMTRAATLQEYYVEDLCELLVLVGRVR